MKKSADEAEFAKVLGCRLTRQRMRRGLTRSALAREVGVAVQTIWRWEKGLSIPNVRDWQNVRNALAEVPEVAR